MNFPTIKVSTLRRKKFGVDLALMLTPTKICVSYLASFATADASKVASHVATDFINEHTSALGSSCTGKDEYLRRLPGFISSMPDLSYEVEQISAEGTHVWVAYTLKAKINGNQVVIRGAMHFEVINDLIAKRVDYWDSQMFKQQAGLA